MTATTRLGLGILASAAALGVLGDTLLRATPWGINGVLWIGTGSAALLGLARRERLALTGGGRWMLIPALLFAAAFAWRDSLTLKALDALAILVALSLVALRARFGAVRLAGVTEYASCMLVAGLNALFGSLLLAFNDIQWKEIPRGGGMKHAVAVGRGLLIALPLLLIFGGLFVAADAVFAHLVTGSLNLDAETLLSHVFLAAACAWLTGGYLRGALLRDQRADDEEPRSQTVTLGTIELGVVLGLLDALFLGFVLVQLRYFFGGSALVQATTGLTYAQYARHGFFELVTVAALVLLLLLLTHWLLRREDRHGERIFRVLAGVQIVLLFVIMASAVQRMRLYQMEYGLTELRFYTMAFMGWLAVVFVWFALTALRGRRNLFAFGALLTGFLAIGLLHIVNPDAAIVRANAIHHRAGHRFDIVYNTSLSADAVPALTEMLSALSPQDREKAITRLLTRWTQREWVDWRTWSLSRSQAQQSLRALK